MSKTPIDNRQTPRVLTSVPCFFGMKGDATHSGTITSLSEKGCFVKTKAVATKDQTIFLHLCLSDKQRIATEGIVVYHINDIGFGALFTEIKAVDQSAINEFVERFLSSK